MASPITTHVLDTAKGRPASGVPVVLEVRAAGKDWMVLGKGQTDADGRLATLLPESSRLEGGTYRLRFDAGAYFQAQDVESFHPEIVVVFTVRDSKQHYHVPLLLSPFGYTTYRGS